MYLLHYAPDNASLIIRLALEELKAPYRTTLVDRAIRQQDSAAYRRLNPQGQIPALETGDGAIFETAAILLWLSERHGGLAPAPGNRDRAGFLKWLFFTSNTLHADLRGLFYPEKYTAPGNDPARQHQQVRTRIERHLTLLDDMGMAERPGWFNATHPSVLTIYVAVCLRWLALYPESTAGWFDLSRYPCLWGIAERMERRPAALRAAAAEGLGEKPFTRPHPAIPPEGSVL